ncbi:MAG: bifunctional phosphoribosylaminoimidazolecarboxamide formyltransferase/IMP cyclohydrolase [Deltaproteobacteria bacterium]|nr:bifunctional phosphoribosylaminoimidazolecarboxamide formyltransferase/IMP cyclohydrolase [Deltaproteobacteria bacterium]
MAKIERALISVSDKTHIIPVSKRLHRMGVRIISTGGTAKILREEKIPVQEVSDVTGFPEMLDGRVKTLHPKIHAGILATDFQRKDILEYGIKPFDLIIVNLYPFEKTIAGKNVRESDAVENIDVGGVTLIRAAAKNFGRVAVVVDPADYEPLIREMTENNCEVRLEMRRSLAIKAFHRTASYDAAISGYFNEEELPALKVKSFKKVMELRYGENPHQKAAFYSATGKKDFEQLQGKQLSFNNIVDIHAGCRLSSEFKEPACVVIKHNNPCGVGIDSQSLLKAFEKAKDSDPVSYFGSIIVFNRPVEEELARELIKDFIEVVVAPHFSAEAKEVFSQKQNLRLIVRSQDVYASKGLEIKKALNGYLLQSDMIVSQENWQVVTKRKPSPEELEKFQFVWRVVKHVKSNAIVVGSESQTYGIGAGQMSRIDSVELALSKAKSKKDFVLASDAFFPFRDSIDTLFKAGVRALVQPGGSIRDNQVIEACDEHDMAMVFTGTRYFVH